MLSRNQIDIMTAQLFQAQKMLIKLFNRNRLPDFSPRKPLILAKNTGQATVRKENSSASIASGKTGLLPKMGRCSSDMHNTSRMTKSPFSLKAVYLTFPWAKSTGRIGKNTLFLFSLNHIRFFFLYYIRFFFLYYIRFLFLYFIYFLYLRHFLYFILVFRGFLFQSPLILFKSGL